MEARFISGNLRRSVLKLLRTQSEPHQRLRRMLQDKESRFAAIEATTIPSLEGGWTVWHLCVLYGREDWLFSINRSQGLIMENVHSATLHSLGFTALHLAIVVGNERAARFLYEKVHLDLRHPDLRGNNCLHLAYLSRWIHLTDVNLDSVQCGAISVSGILDLIFDHPGSHQMRQLQSLQILSDLLLTPTSMRRKIPLTDVLIRHEISSACKMAAAYRPWAPSTGWNPFSYNFAMKEDPWSNVITRLQDEGLFCDNEVKKTPPRTFYQFSVIEQAEPDVRNIDEEFISLLQMYKESANEVTTSGVVAPGDRLLVRHRKLYQELFRKSVDPVEAETLYFSSLCYRHRCVFEGSVERLCQIVIITCGYCFFFGVSRRSDHSRNTTEDLPSYEVSSSLSRPLGLDPQKAMAMKLTDIKLVKILSTMESLVLLETKKYGDILIETPWKADFVSYLLKNYKFATTVACIEASLPYRQHDFVVQYYGNDGESAPLALVDGTRTIPIKTSNGLTAACLILLNFPTSKTLGECLVVLNINQICHNRFAFPIYRTGFVRVLLSPPPKLSQTDAAESISAGLVESDFLYVMLFPNGTLKVFETPIAEAHLWGATITRSVSITTLELFGEYTDSTLTWMKTNVMKAVRTLFQERYSGFNSHETQYCIKIGIEGNPEILLIFDDRFERDDWARCLQTCALLSYADFHET
eukprot:Gregarina_sp_Poly_1__3298@NODE_1948_length_3019_cov_4_541667_g1254_i0_p1_GENE_NODE_1948_length_3019_cov_4_541667_g1254_i0NODE_1948_length_3019_cov_4_541667_g1254_i0_p1_ORF_typecomplete_len723_score80_85Ank_4/PF13637_6/2_3e02Ank_4/PF13637_6/2e05Ank_2/PF12796_7/1_5e03Ank_2/PF12796_7/0_0011Ank_5/PF13857_6/2_6e03Ank_5/PF13857_6/0_12Ank_5/PF13857_6/3_5e02Ank/PF00023_30/1_2e04Ank/PF00023_30/0_054Ank/PF00023_30/3_1e03Ank_3/PF13606_6/2_4e03Ank_3/PF13606_6/0_47Ank_3/PF13606_6/6_7e02_NODE_1948_length_3019